MTNIKTLFIGAALALAGVCLGEGIAHANCDRDESEGQSYYQARLDADECDTNYSEVVRVRDGFEAYCVPNDVAEDCIDVSSLLDCSLMSAERCDEQMGQMFQACMALQFAGGR
jgi:hypothetical protein